MLSETMRRRLRLQRRAADYRATFGGGAGRRVLADLARRNNLLATSVVAGDPQLTAFNEGRRAVVLEILRELRWDDRDLEQLSLERDDDE